MNYFRTNSTNKWEEIIDSNKQLILMWIYGEELQRYGAIKNLLEHITDKETISRDFTLLECAGLIRPYRPRPRIW